MTSAAALLDLPAWLCLSVAAAVGLCVGSFLNVCIYRLPLGLSIVRPGSRCPGCGTFIRWFDNIPVLSYLLLRGRCRTCAAPIRFRYPGVELLTGLLFAAVLARFGPVVPLGAVVFYWVFTALLVAITFIDLEHMIIPDELSVFGLLAGILLNLLYPALLHGSTWWMSASYAVCSAAVMASLLYLTGAAGSWVFKKEALGMGDVKLIAMIAATLGLQQGLLALLFSALSGSAVSLVLVSLGRAGMKDPVPYGPFLALGAWGALLWGEAFFHWYGALLQGTVVRF